MVFFWVCDEIRGMGRGSLAKPQEGLVKPSSSPAVLTAGRAKENSLAPIQDCLWQQDLETGQGGPERPSAAEMPGSDSIES